VDRRSRIWPLEGSHHNAACIYGNSPVTTLDWEPKSGKLLLCGDSDGRVKLWNASGDKIVGDIAMSSVYKRVVHVRCGPPASILFAVSSASENTRQGGTLTLWDVNKLQSVNKMKFEPPTVLTSIAFNHNGSVFVATDQDGYVRLFDINRGKQISKWKAHQYGACGVTFSSDETSIYSVGLKEKIKCWSAHSMGQLLKSYNYIGIDSGVLRSDISLDVDGHYFLVASHDNYGLLYHVDQSKPLQTVGSHGQPVVSVDWHPIHNTCITASLDHTVCMTHFNIPEK